MKAILRTLTYLLYCLLGAPLLHSVSAETKIRQENHIWRVSQTGDPTLESLITEDGSLASLRFLNPDEIYNLTPNPHRSDFLKTGIGMPHTNSLGGARGIFLWQDQAVPLHTITAVNEHNIQASSERASILYDFSTAQRLTLTATNQTDEAMLLLMVLDSTVLAVQAPETELTRTPAIRLWPDTIWYQDGTTVDWKIEIKGGDRIWGPSAEVGTAWREGLHQVWEAQLAPQQTRTVTLQASRLPATEAAIIKAHVPEEVPVRRAAQIAFPLAPQANDSSLSVYSPKDYQVFQRATQASGKLRIAGAFRGECDRVEARVHGNSAFGILPGDWQTIAYDSISKGFSTELKLPAGGWYQVEIRTLLEGNVVAQKNIEHVGIGEVFIICGQSNSTNYGSTEMTRNRTQTGLVASFGGAHWQLCEDPLPGSSDGSQGGSPWTFFGDAMVRQHKVPIGIAITGHGGAPVQYWRPGSFPFLWITARINQFEPDGFRALLWHQGESSVYKSSEHYYETLKEIIEATRQVAGWEIPWMVAQVSYRSPKEPSFSSTRDAQAKVWAEGFALPGPDTDLLIGPDRAGIHFSTDGLQKHGEQWADFVSQYLESILY